VGMCRVNRHFFRAKIIGLICCVAAFTACQRSKNQGTEKVSSQSKGSPPGETLWVNANGLRLKAKIYQSTKLSSHPVLIVVLHGDLLGVKAVPPVTYHYVFAHEATVKMEDLVVAALLRPGYRDDTGEQSQGDHGLARFHPAHTVLAGHSGGAAITGDLLGGGLLQWMGH
jgi:hypothetical protein